MQQFDKTLSVPNNVAQNLLAFVVANGYTGFQLNPLADNLCLTAPSDTILYHGNSGAITAAAPSRSIAAGVSYPFPRTVDLSQIWIIHNGGAAKNVGISFTGLGEHN